MGKYFFFLLISLSVFSQKVSERKLEKLIDQIPAFENAHVAVRVEKSNKILADFNGSKYMTPASNTKLLTFLGAIQTFDSLPALEYFVENDSVIHFKSTGYPLLLHPFYSDTLLFDFLNQEKIWKYHVPEFTPDPLGEGWAWDDYNYYYAAEKSPFPIYGNSVMGIKGSGLIPSFEIIEDSINNNLVREKDSNLFYSNIGNWKTKDTLYRPFITSDSLFVKILSEVTRNQIKIVKGEDSLTWQTLYTGNDEKLYKGLLHDSDNGIAESLLLMISNSFNGAFDTQIAIDWLTKDWESFIPDPLEWVDGSGVSRYNMFTPRSLISILKQIRKEIDWNTIKELFAKSGESGTLSSYSKLNNVYAKTGTLRHNHNLSGYWENEDGEIYEFCVMVNHYTSSTLEIREGISTILTNLQQKLD
ncbi:MAG: D-alanyl-D-alanine carboxypeptidase [Bacteroidetes bacterium]|nr:D-alanyl-D-alanine carboxypeptidase [Bacteroidota bacterium]MDA1289018.1 D-alanyl-D-alanine carboxypeptidase [Bacteroidota bacterium]